MFCINDILSITNRLVRSGYRKIVDNSDVMVFHRVAGDRVYLYSDRTRVSATSSRSRGFEIVCSILGCPAMRLPISEDVTVNFWS